MALFSRRRATRDSARQQAAITAFWSWWSAQGAAATAAAIADRDLATIAEALTERVHAVHDDLQWELGAGSRGAEHVLVVTAGGDPDLRAVARRWLREAPTPDATWEYADARQPAPNIADLVLQIGDVALDAGEVRVSARVRGAAVDVGLYHPAFADLPEETRTTATFLLLDQALGESSVETWVGEISSSVVEPIDPIPLTGLPSVVDQLHEMHTDDSGAPTWAILEGSTRSGARVMAMAQVPLRYATAPHLDTHVGVTVPFSDANESGLPGPGSLGALRDLEDHLAARVGGSGRLVAHQTAEGVRVLHFYVDSSTPAADQVRAATGGWEQGRVRVDVTPDPGWQAVSHLRG